MGNKMYLLIEWEGRTGKSLFEVMPMTDSQIFSRTAQPYFMLSGYENKKLDFAFSQVAIAHF